MTFCIYGLFLSFSLSQKTYLFHFLSKNVYTKLKPLWISIKTDYQAEHKELEMHATVVRKLEVSSEHGNWSYYFSYK